MLSTVRRLRIATAMLLGAAALAFTAGTAAERSSHHESPARRAVENAVASTAPALPPVVPDPTPASNPPTATPTAVAPSGLNAPEGSEAREAAEHATAIPVPPASSASVATAAASVSPEPVPGAAAAADAPAPEGSAAREAAEGASGGEVSGEAGERLFGVNTESSALVALAAVISLLLLLLVLLAPTGAALRVVALLTVGFTGAATALDLREALHQHDLGQSGLVGAALGVGALHLLCALTAAALLTRPQPTRPAPA